MTLQGTDAQRRAVFIDKDGTLVHDVPYNVDPRRLKFTPHALEGLNLLADAGFALIVVSNQSGIARGLFDRPALDRYLHVVTEQLADAGVFICGIYVCPHESPAHGPTVRGNARIACTCRTPAPGLLRRAAAEHGIALRGSWMVGDILDDVEAGARAGCRTVLLDVGNETQWRSSPVRTPTFRARDLRDAAHTILRHQERVGFGTAA